jgi:hypothetical protein
MELPASMSLTRRYVAILAEREKFEDQIQRVRKALKGHELTPERGLAHVSYMRPEQLAAMGIKSGTGQTE